MAIEYNHEHCWVFSHWCDIVTGPDLHETKTSTRSVKVWFCKCGREKRED